MTDEAIAALTDQRYTAVPSTEYAHCFEKRDVDIAFRAVGWCANPSWNRQFDLEAHSQHSHKRVIVQTFQPGEFIKINRDVLTTRILDGEKRLRQAVNPEPIPTK